MTLSDIDSHGWAELRDDAEGKSVSMRVFPWPDYSLLIRAVRQWHDRAVYLEPKYLDNIPVLHMDKDVEGLFDEHERETADERVQREMEEDADQPDPYGGL